MHYVYLIRSISHPDQTYVGLTDHVENRLKKHNEGGSPSTSLGHSCLIRPSRRENKRLILKPT